MSMLQPGDKVVCINGNWSVDAIKRFSSMPVENKVYEVRSVLSGPRFKDNRRVLGIRLIGIMGSLLSDGQEVGFEASNFRKLDELMEDQSVKDLIAEANKYIELTFEPATKHK